MEARKKPFTEFERCFLVNIIQQHAAIIKNKRTDGVSSQKKAAAWTKIAQEYNKSTRVTQKVDVKQVKKFWNNLKMKYREAKTKENQINFTGGGPAIPDMDPLLVLSTVPNILPIVKDANSDTVNGQEDDDSKYWTHIKNREHQFEDYIVLPESPPDPDEESLETPGTSDPGPSQFPTSGTTLNSTRHHMNGLDSPKVENFKLKILEQDYTHREKKFKVEMDHLRKIQEIEFKMKNKELEHKSMMYSLYEEEVRLKIEILRNKNNAD